MTKQQIAETQIIAAAPEKWDVITTWGANLPAHTFINKGAQIYKSEKGWWVESNSCVTFHIMFHIWPTLTPAPFLALVLLLPPFAARDRRTACSA